MNFLKSIFNGILAVVGIIIGYLLVNVGRAMLVWFFAPDSWTPEKILIVSASLFTLIGIVKLLIKRGE